MKRAQQDPGDPADRLPRGPLDEALLAEARDGRIPCTAVFRVAAAQGVATADAGRAVQRLGIRITGCQLGCF
jgi:hypothetical protein